MEEKCMYCSMNFREVLAMIRGNNRALYRRWKAAGMCSSLERNIYVYLNMLLILVTGVSECGSVYRGQKTRRKFPFQNRVSGFRHLNMCSKNQ